MTNEVKYSRFGESGEYVDRINFDDLVKLYVNHRPVFAVGPEQIRQAFQAMKRCEPGPLARDVLLNLLTTHGEKMTYDELERHLEDLTGDSNIHRALDEEVDALDFAHGVLGLSEEQESAEAMGSVDAGRSGFDASTMALSSPANASATM